MPGYITKQLQKYQHEIAKRPQYSPYPSALKKYGSSAQEPIKSDDYKTSGRDKINCIQKIVGSTLYYERSVDPTILMALSTLSSEQAKATMQTIKNLHQQLDYLVTHPDATMRYYASNMILNIHSYA